MQEALQESKASSTLLALLQNAEAQPTTSPQLLINLCGALGACVSRNQLLQLDIIQKGELCCVPRACVSSQS